MMFRAAVLSALVAVASAQVCSICGDGQRVPEASKDEIFMFPGQPTVPCGTLEQAGVNGQIPVESCPFLPGLVNACNCEPGAIQPPTAPSPAPIAPTPAPVIPTAAPIAPVPAPVPAAPTGCPAVPSTGCSVCGEGLCVGNAEAIFSFPDQPPVPCGDLEVAGLGGQILANQCSIIPVLSELQICECGTGNEPMPTDAPVDPTPAPVAPTPAPVEPTDAPVTAAPVAPVTAAPVAPSPFPVFIMTPAPVEATAAPADTAAPVQGEGDGDDDEDSDDDEDGDDDDDDDDGSSDEEDSSDDGMGMKSKTKSAMSKSRKKMGMSAMGMARKLGAQGIPAAVGFRGAN